MIKLSFPFTEEKVRALKVGDEVLISGVIHTGRDAVHKYLHEGGALPPGVSLRDGILYHCGPVVMNQADGSWKATAAGPTTSIREEPYEASVIAHYGFGAIIGKGGMGAKTLAALRKHGAVYLHAVGGAAQVLARKIVRVQGVRHLEEIGVPEAMWILEVKDFPCLVTMDSHGQSLHDELKESSRAIFDELIGKKKPGAAA